jgi:hypothetical protein
MGNYSSKASIENKKTGSGKKEKNVDHKNNKSNKTIENTNKIKQNKAEDQDKLSKEKRKHYLNRLTFINRRETFVENHSIPRNSIGACSYYDENNNLFDHNPDFSNNFENVKFSNSFVDDYNPNNEYLNNYLNSHKINEANLNGSINLINLNKSIHKRNSRGMRNSVSEENLILSNEMINKSKGNLHFESFNYRNIAEYNLNRKKNIINDLNMIGNSSSRNSDLKNTFFNQNTRASFGYDFNLKRHSMNSNKNFNNFNIKELNNDEYFDSSFIDKNCNNNYRKHRKTIISNLINNSISLRKNNEKEEKSSDLISPNDSLYDHIINNSQMFNNKNCDANKISDEKINNKQSKLEANAYYYAETRNSLFLDLKNQEFFFDNQSSNNLANNSYSDFRSTSDTKVFDISKPRAKTPNRELKSNESDISETKTIEFLSKSYEVFDINHKKQEDVLSSENSIEINFDKENSSIDKNYKRSISFEYEKVKKMNLLNKSKLENSANSIKISSFYDNKINNHQSSFNNLNSFDNIKKRKSISNVNLAQVYNKKEFLLYNKNLNAISKNIFPNDIIANNTKDLDTELNHFPKFRRSIISNIHALNKSSSNIYNNLNKKNTKIEMNNLNNSYFYTKTFKSNSDTKSIVNSDTNSTSFRITLANNTFNSKVFEEAQSRYKLNFCRVKHSENLRKNYIAKLIYKQIWQPSKKEKNHNSLIIFDWDDTLLCTSFLTPNGIYREDLKITDKDLEKLAKLEFSVLRLLTLAVEKGDVYIITNATPGWVEYSAEKYYPSLKSVIKKINIVSARGDYEKDFPGDSRMWKIQAFLNIQKDFDSNLITSIICLGDSFIEMEAAQILAGKFSKAFIKSVKFRESPKPEELNKQLTLVADQFLSIYATVKNLTIRVERKSRK